MWRCCVGRFQVMRLGVSTKCESTSSTFDCLLFEEQIWRVMLRSAGQVIRAEWARIGQNGTVKVKGFADKLLKKCFRVLPCRRGC
jgi:hypothetical protein